METEAIVAIIVGVAVVLLVVLILVAKKSGAPKVQKVCGGCRRVMLPVWTKCLFCGWAPVARLEFILGPMANQTLNLSDEVTTIGSVAGNTVVLADPAVSRKHAGIRKVDGNYELADLGSTNGVYVNGHKVPKKTLDQGDIIRVGNTEAVFKRE
ncbi:MAG: FHA domain-containing protein [Deltaproteobacteria bacterium]|nr:FHA domain-containing protein [Deltaproteobacteria bacterium]MCW5806403.1 FHA domain-containing protein [Deltaproteobacteria bacterium]